MSEELTHKKKSVSLNEEPDRTAGEGANATAVVPNGEVPPHKSGGEAPALRARLFPTARTHMSTSPHLSRCVTESQEILQRGSMDFVNEAGNSGRMPFTVDSPTNPPAAVDPFMTVIYPAKFGGGGGGENEDGGDYIDAPQLLRQRDNLGRTQVLVEGYFQDDMDAVGALIPNDLPRSTVLYVLTASEGRDKLLKCLQYGLQTMMCFLKHPMLFSPDSQVLVDYWAERFWRNGNTIRHGRSLFKLGRWVLNILYLKEVIDRLVMKHGNAVRGLLDRLKTSVSSCFWIPHTSALLGYKRKTGTFPGEKGVGSADTSKMDSLVTDDMYSCVARAEFPWRRIMPTTTLGRRQESVSVNPDELTAAELNATRCFYVKDKVYNTIHNMIAENMNPDQPQGKQLLPDSSEAREDSSYASATRMESVPQEALSSPPSVQSTMPASLMADTWRHNSMRRSPLVPETQLLRPLRTLNDSSTGDETAHNNNGDDQHHTGGAPEGTSPTKRTNDGGKKSLNQLGDKVGCPSGYLSLFHTLPYEPRLGDALPSPCNATGGHQHGGSRFLSNRSKQHVALYDEYEEEEEPFEVPSGEFNGSNISLASSGVVGTTVYAGGHGEKGMGGEEQGIPAEMGLPVQWRKRVLQFSTPLMLLLGLRNIMAIGRRVLRDVLLLSSENFLNLSLVEKNRPMLQRRVNWIWLVVALSDLLLNTIRLADKGWYKYASTWHSTRYRCRCNDNEETDVVTRYRNRVARRKVSLFFPPVDLDFGAPISSSPAYFEAADPKRIAPACSTCGCLFVEVGTDDGGDDQPQQDEQLLQGRRRGTKHGDHLGERSANDSDAARATARSSSSSEDTTQVAVLLIPWLMRKMSNIVWLLRTHPNWTATILLQIRYLTEVYVAFKYCFGGYESGKSDASLPELLHPSGAIAELIGAVLGLQRVIESAPN